MPDIPTPDPTVADTMKKILVAAGRDGEERDAEKDRLAAEVHRLREAIRLTREYVGPRALPAVPGWDWFDAIQATGGCAGFGACGRVLDPHLHGRPRTNDLFYCRLPAGHDGDCGNDRP